MVFVVKVKSGVEFARIAPAGFRILEAISACTRECQVDLTITSGTDGEHSGPADPHYTGEAFDLRIDFDADMLSRVLAFLTLHLGEAFTVIHEHSGATAQTTAAHIHVQRAKGTVYPAVPASH